MMHRKQKGVTLIELILVVGLIAFLTMLSFQEKQLEMEQRRARQVGAQLFQINNAIRNWLSEQTGTTALNMTKSGVTWLKPNSCGGSSGRPQGYLPCTFPDATVARPIPFGNLALSMNLTRTYNAVTKEVDLQAITTSTAFTLPRSASASDVRSDLAGIAALSASSGMMSVDDPTPVTTDAKFSSDPLTAVITMETSNRADKDAWLRTDGGNDMDNNIRFNTTKTASLRQVLGVSRLKSLASEVLYLGGTTTGFPANGGGSGVNLSASEKVVIDSDTRIYGSLRANADLIALRNIQAGQDITSGRDIKSGRDLKVMRDVDVDGKIYADGQIRTVNSMQAPIFYDENDTRWYADPNSTSRLNWIRSRNVASLDTATPLQITSNQLDWSHESGSDTKFTGNVNVDSLMVKKNGNYVSLSALLPNFVHMASWYATDGKYVPYPNCMAGGQPRIIVTPQTIPTNIQRNSYPKYNIPVGVTYFSASYAGGGWTVHSYTDSGSYAGNGTAIAATYCLY